MTNNNIDKLGIDIELSPYEEYEKRVIGGKIVNVTYHAIDWRAVFDAKN